MNILWNLDKRCQEILKRLMYAGGYLKIQDLADEMQISRRSVYYDITKINEWLEDQDIDPLVQERGKGIFVSSDQSRRIQEALSDQGSDNYHVFTPEERSRIEICAIIIRSHPLYIENFMEVCQVSRNTVINDLKNVIRFLENYNLELTYDIKSGYRIAGDTIKKRAIFFMLFPSLWEYYDRQVVLAENEQRIREILVKLKKIESELHAEYVSGVLPTLAVFMSAIDKRSDELTFSDMDEEEIVETREYQLVSQYFPDLENGEKIYVTLHLLGSRLQTIPVNVMKEQDETYEISKNLVHEFERLTCIFFDQEEELVDAINAHLKTSLYRYRYGIQLGNPMLNSIKTEYEELYEITKKSCEYLEKKLGCLISDAEVAYITLHFGAFLTTNQTQKRNLRILIICPNGIGTGNMLRNEVASLVPQATEIVNLPLSQYEEDHDFDVVISTVVLPKEKKLIVMHPILTDQDRVTILRNCMYTEPQANLQIQEIVRLATSYIPSSKLNEFEKDLQDYYSSIQIRTVPHRNFGQNLVYYLKPSHIQICRDACDWEEALRLSCKPLLMEDSITQEYVEAIVADQKNRGLMMFLADGLVLAHAAIEKGVKQLDVALCTFKHPVTFLNGKQARIIIVLCAEDQTKHIRILNDVLNIFSKKKSIEQLTALDSSEDIQGYIRSHTQENEG